MRAIVAAILLGIFAIFVLSGCDGPKSETIKALDQTLETLTRHGVTYEASLSGPTQAEAYTKTTFGLGSGGHIDIRFSSPKANPMMGKIDGPMLPVPSTDG